ncbi:shikimate dehydrogenase family protein [Sphingobacterium cellulitidis]|uniref:Shikimate 5-dehydrogenase n=1 Tax=Sphingobacterium cellulitidis TaxID=1768011 RepID=A0A8H9G1V6_9SPHI|nr:shikimate dehydrogenase [Sphingobacterium soli]MBA8988634.1 shikimate dehydrogenase [Sphingobacterium soli]GGE34416.1 shikimate 5-dehydrogenase [Sphingobacterium soli]
MKKLGLIGYPLGHSFSKKYYLEKFEKEGIKNIDYDLYPLPSIQDFPNLYENHPEFYGVNVTIPYKQDVMQYITELSEEAKEIEAVNCIQIRNVDGTTHLKGFNTDAFGFQKSLEPLLTPQHKKALIFGNGGATKAVAYALKKLGIDYQVVSRTKSAENITYEDLSPELIQESTLLVNCTPLGTFPKIEECPNLPYEAITEKHLLYDLIYNPEETLFLKKGKEKGAKIKNGYEMLILQAEKNWEIWNQ